MLNRDFYAYLPEPSAGVLVGFAVLACAYLLRPSRGMEDVLTRAQVPIDPVLSDLTAHSSYAVRSQEEALQADGDSP